MHKNVEKLFIAIVINICLYSQRCRKRWYVIRSWSACSCWSRCLLHRRIRQNERATSSALRSHGTTMYKHCQSGDRVQYAREVSTLIDAVLPVNFYILISLRCSIVAAANPSGGHYNKAKTVSENLRMSGALLSRFDLVYILLDTPNEQRDK